jgi:hypothetical protein
MSDTLEPKAPSSGAAEDLGFDPDALKARYRAERDKRLRQDGNEQYQEIAGSFAHYLEDPYVPPGFTRDPITDETEVVVIGGGFGGLLAAARLREAGIADIRIIEKGGDFGGTWYWNRYPGPPATSRATSTCRCWKRSATCRSRSTPARPRSSPTAARSASTSTSTRMRSSRPR